MRSASLIFLICASVISCACGAQSTQLTTSRVGTHRIAVMPIVDSTRRFVVLTINGAITKELANSVRAVVSEKSQLSILNIEGSLGGSMQDAIELGRLARVGNAKIHVAGECSSACVLVLAGGVLRDYGEKSRIGLHRPYFDASLGSLGRTQSETRRFESAIRDYLREMNVQDRLIEWMNAVPSEKMRYLSASELAALGLGKADRVFEEYSDAKSAEKLGIDRQEYLRRKAAFVEFCEPLDRSSEEFCACADRSKLRAKGEFWPCDLKKSRNEELEIR